MPAMINGSGNQVEAQVAEKGVPQMAPMATVDLGQLPAVISPGYDKRLAEAGVPVPGLERPRLVSPQQLSPQQLNTVKQIVTKWNMNDTTSVLTFAAEPQKKVNLFLDSLMGDIKVRDAGVAGDMAKQMASGIDLMQLAKVKNQITNPPSTALIPRIWRWIFGWTNYLRNFYLNQQPILSLVKQMEGKANNRMVTLDNHVKKLDAMADASVVQIRDLAVWIVAGEEILIQSTAQYNKRREEVLLSHDVVEASRLRDMARQIAAFEKRWLEVEIAYSEAGNLTIPQIRMTQEADKIEIQNISEQLLFQMPKFKKAIILMAALADTKSAADDRKLMDQNQRQLDKVLTDTVGEANKIAKESQGDVLQKVQDLEENIGRMETIIKEQIEIEARTHAMREEAHARVVACRDVVGNALKSANLESAARS